MLDSRSTGHSARRTILPLIGVAAVALLLANCSGITFAQDDWEVVQHSQSGQSEDQGAASADTSTAPASATSSAASSASGKDGKATTVCGERATPAAPAIKAIIDRINELWGSNFQVYQTVALEQPHASAGGCIFYNMTAMNMLMALRLDVNDPNAAAPMLWAIFAHEAGHEYHRDSEASRADVPIEIKELEADRFAGYTLEKLQIRATDLTPFWTMTGDEYGGGANATNQHGSSAQRVAAFKQGWNLAEWNRAEDSQSVQDALNESVAPDSPDSAPK
jgi:predicted metalloprotease